MNRTEKHPWYLCEHCIEAIRSRGEKIFMGEAHYDEDIECAWCGEVEDVVYECK